MFVLMCFAVRLPALDDTWVVGDYFAETAGEFLSDMSPTTKKKARRDILELYLTGQYNVRFFNVPVAIEKNILIRI